MAELLPGEIMRRFTTPLVLAMTLASCSADALMDPLPMSGAPRT